jgi:hypothetical protein
MVLVRFGLNFGGLTEVTTHQLQSQSQFKRFPKRNPNLNTNYNCLVMSDEKQPIDKWQKTRRAESIAFQLCDKFNNHDYFSFYCKVALKLPEYRIWQLVEEAQRGHQPARLFSFLCKKAGV